MRGLPGGGKSTYVRQAMLAAISSGNRSVAVCSTDDQCMVDGKYVFDPTLVGIRHKNNQVKCQKMMNAGVEVIYIDNTNTTHKEMQPYKDFATTAGYEVQEVLIGKEHLFPDMDGSPHKFTDYIDMCAKRNTHNVPRETIEKMARRFQE